MATSSVFPYAFTNALCTQYANQIASDITTTAAGLGARIVTPFALASCSASMVKVCGEFFSSADGALLQNFVSSTLPVWSQMVKGPAACPAYLNGYTVMVAMGGDGSNVLSLPAACVSGEFRVACNPETVDFPKCECNTRRGITPFAISPSITRMAGRTSDTTLYCFTVSVITPSNPDSACGASTTLLKVEFYADDTQRRALNAIGLQTALETQLTFQAGSWGSSGDQTLKATPLNWSRAQANGAKICLELDNDVSLDDFCLGGTTANTCWANLFDVAKDCCPLYSSTLA